MPATVLWPERESLYDLMKHRATIGHAAFEAEKQGSPIDPERCEWPASYFDGAGFWIDAMPLNLEISTAALDPSKGSESKVGDYSALVKLGRDHNQRLYCEADLQRRTVEIIVDATIELVRTWKPEGLAIETNQFQELLVAPMQEKARQAKLHLPVYRVVNSVNKQVRIRRLGPYLSQRKIRFVRTPGTRLLVDQLRDFPVSDHDDGPDALEMALRLTIELWNGRRAKK